MIKINTYPKAIAAFIVTLIILSVILSSCYTENKAGKQVAKALREYPDTAAALIRDDFPCVDGNPDSTEFKASIDSLRKQLADTAGKIVKASTERVKEIRDSLIRAQAASGDDCSTLLAQTTDYIAQSNVTRDSLKWELDNEKGIRRRLAAYINNIKPVIQPVEDSAKIRLANKDRDKAIMEAVGWKALYDQDHAWRVKQEKKMAGSLVIYIPWWLIIVAGIILGLSIFARIKAGVFNPLKLLTKKSR